jgi:hypothetical protein
MTGLDKSRELLASRDAALYRPLISQEISQQLDNPIRKHDADGIVPIEPTLGSREPDLGPIHETGTARHEERTSVLLEAQDVIHGARSRDYGAALDNHTATADMLSAYLRRKYGFPLELTAEDVCLFNVLQKVARLANTPDHRDSLVDIAGYAGNVEMVQQERARRG